MSTGVFVTVLEELKRGVEALGVNELSLTTLGHSTLEGKPAFRPVRSNKSLSVKISVVLH